MGPLPDWDSRPAQVGRSSAQAAPKLDVGDYQPILNAIAA